MNEKINDLEVCKKADTRATILSIPAGCEANVPGVNWNIQRIIKDLNNKGYMFEIAEYDSWADKYAVRRLITGVDLYDTPEPPDSKIEDGDRMFGHFKYSPDWRASFLGIEVGQTVKVSSSRVNQLRVLQKRLNSQGYDFKLKQDKDILFITRNK